MVFDAVRNTAYARAIRDAVRPGCTVLDLGAGLGIHGLLAAAAGAGKVILLDPSPVVELAADIARKNGISGQVEIIRKSIAEVDSLAPVDLIVSVFAGNFLLSEDLLPYLFSARERFLKPGGAMIPGMARMKAALLCAGEYYEKHVVRWSQPILDVDFSPIRRFAANTIYYDSAATVGGQLLSQPVQLQALDFTTAKVAECRSQVEIPVERSGTCHGLLGWFDLQLGDAWLSTGPDAEPMHWSVAFLPLDPPLELTVGETLQLELDRPEFGEWTWTVTRGAQRQRHSTFGSNLADLSYFKKISPDRAPSLGRKGEFAMLVLSQLAAGATVAELTALVKSRLPELAEHDPQLDKRIRNLIAEWGAEVV